MIIIEGYKWDNQTKKLKRNSTHKILKREKTNIMIPTRKKKKHVDIFFSCRTRLGLVLKFTLAQNKVTCLWIRVL